MRYNLTAIYIDRGIIGLILPNGEIANYRQRGLSQLSEEAIYKLIEINLLRTDYLKFKELPNNFSIHFEDESIQGKARATFPNLNKWKMLS